MFAAFPVCCSFPLYAGQWPGIVADSASGSPLKGVFVENVRNGAVALTDAGGNFSIEGAAGDRLRCSLIGYTHGSMELPGETYTGALFISLAKKYILIHEVEVRPGLSPYQQDSLERREIFGKKVDQKQAKFGFDKKGVPSAGYGAVFSSPISGPYQKLSRKYKRLRAFQKRFREQEQQLFANSRYTPELVAQLTGLEGDTLATFMNSYPVSGSFIRTASETELKMWIRFNYRQWIRKEETVQQAGR